VMTERHAEYDDAEVTPAPEDDAVGRVGGVEDESFAQEDGAEVRAQADRAQADAASTDPESDGGD